MHGFTAGQINLQQDCSMPWAVHAKIDAGARIFHLVVAQDFVLHRRSCEPPQLTLVGFSPVWLAKPCDSYEPR